MKLKLEAGKYYVNGYGEKLGPAKECPHPVYCFTLNDLPYTNSGEHLASRTTLRDLVSEWVEPKAEPDVLPFGKLTPVEQGALLLARRNGEIIEVAERADHYDWHSAFAPAWYDHMLYRIKPKPKMQAEYWVVFNTSGSAQYVSKGGKASLAIGSYKVHHPAVEIKE